jgi:hypothetical protein
MAAAVLTFKTFYIFEAEARFGVQMIVINFGILLLIWFLSFNHTGFSRENMFMVLVLPLIGLHITNLMLILNSPGTSFVGYIGFLVSSSLLIFTSYKARSYEKHLKKASGWF